MDRIFYNQQFVDVSHTAPTIMVPVGLAVQGVRREGFTFAQQQAGLVTGYRGGASFQDSQFIDDFADRRSYVDSVGGAYGSSTGSYGNNGQGGNFDRAYGKEAGFTSTVTGGYRGEAGVYGEHGGYSGVQGGYGQVDRDIYSRQSSLSESDSGYNRLTIGYNSYSGADDSRVSFGSRLDEMDFRDRDRDRLRAADSRDGRHRREDSWDRGSKGKDRERDWGGSEGGRSSERDRSPRDRLSPRERRRDRRSSRDRGTRDRSPRSDMEMSDDSGSRMDVSEEDGADSPSCSRRRDSRSRSESDRDKDRTNHRHSHRDRRDRDRDRDRERDRSRERDRDRDRGDREGERWMTEEPSATILLRGLCTGVTENDVIQELVRVEMAPKDVRFMRRVTGASRGFGFVEFQSQAEAQRWMDLNQGQLKLPGTSTTITMHYSAPRVARDPRDHANRMDWMCKCGAHNFKRRDFCYKCNTNRRLAEDPLCGVTELDPATHVGKNPCNTLLFRDLDALTTEQGVLQAIAALTSLPIKNCQVIRDDLSTSLCFALLELNSVASAKQLHDFLLAQNPPLAIDGKQVTVSYAQNTFNTSVEIILKAQQKLAQNQYYLNYNSYYSADSGQYYSQYYDSQSTAATSVTSGNSTNAAAAVAQTAIMQAQAAKSIATAAATPAVDTIVASAKVTPTATTSTTDYPVYPPPDVSQYQYDKTSGYYYDPSTGLYYEPNTQYYYNAKTTQWMYWDAGKSTYLPAPNQGEEATGLAADGTNEKGEKEEKKEKEKSKVAKKIAKDMEKWAKAMNAQKDALKEEQRKNTLASGRKESAAADAGFAILQKSKEDMKLMPPPPLAVNPAPAVSTIAATTTTIKATSSGASGLVASYGGDSDDSDNDTDADGGVDESKLIDFANLACLLCKRKFQSREILSKHTQFSDLHKQNLESLKTKSSAGKVEKREYRDRAKERREKYGPAGPPQPSKPAASEPPVAFEQPTKAGIGEDNIGNKMMQKMGWTSGLGLGKSNQGRVTPIETQRRAANAGLGARGADIVAEEGATYKENVKKTLFARYKELDKQ